MEFLYVKEDTVLAFAIAIYLMVVFIQIHEYMSDIHFDYKLEKDFPGWPVKLALIYVLARVLLWPIYFLIPKSVRGDQGRLSMF